MVQTRMERHPLVVQLHGCSTVNALQRGERPGLLVRFLERRIVSLADDVRAVARDTANRTFEALGLGQRPVRVIPNSVDTEYFSTTPVSDGRPQVLFVGKLNRTKGAWVVAEFAQPLLERNPELTLVLAGLDSTEDGQSVQKGLTSRVSVDVRNRLVFPGRLSRDQVREAYRRARVVVVPSLSEACPMVVLEAMATGRPVVASRRGGIPELIEEGGNGFLADPAHPPSFVAPIEALLQDRVAAARMGRRGRELAVARHSTDEVMRAVLAGYETVLRTPRRRRAGQQ
jgi:glycosyltransferase involved in cell wall biosynthesis